MSLSIDLANDNIQNEITKDSRIIFILPPNYNESPNQRNGLPDLLGVQEPFDSNFINIF